MILCIVNSPNIIKLYNAISILVQLLEGLSHQTLPSLVHFPYHASQELVITDIPVSVQVKH